ncbi:MAG: hypothetical protein E7242_05650 [Lachnospiraceae bacterium]|nr:hypothetical protein [Lachnospiraceae bacterium]
MTLIGKRTMKIAAVILVAAMVVLMLPMVAKAATSYEPDEGSYAVRITTDGVKTDDSDTTGSDIAVFSNFGFGETMSADGIVVDATAKTVSFKNLVVEGQEMYLQSGADGYTFIFEGTNSIPAINTGFGDSGNITIDLKDDSSKLTLTNIGYGCIIIEGSVYININLADGVNATPADFITRAEADFQAMTEDPSFDGWYDGTVVFSKGGSSEDTPTSDYVINDGSTDPITAQTGKDLVIKCSGPLEHLSKVLMDGNEVAAENMSLENGSTILTLKAAYLATLAAGEHTVSFVYDDGTTVDATFTLAKTPQTGDPMATYVLIAAIAAGTVMTVVVAKKKAADER